MDAMMVLLDTAMRLRHVATVVLIAAVGCQEPTQIQVNIAGDDIVWDNLEAMEIRIWSREPGDIGGETEQEVLVAMPNTRGLEQPYEVPLAPKGRDSRRRYRIQVSAQLAEGEVVARAISGYEANRTRQLLVYLAGDCIDAPDCEDEQTCRGGICVDAEVPVETLCEFPPGDPRCSDAAVDSGRDTQADTRADSSGDTAMDRMDTGPDTDVDAGMCVWPDTGCRIDTASCDVGEICIVQGESTRCAPEGAGNRAGDSCDTLNSCAPGAGCAVVLDDGTCRPVCPLLPEVCSCADAEERCLSVGGTTYGFCFETCDDPARGGGCASANEECKLFLDPAQPHCGASVRDVTVGDACTPGGCPSRLVCVSTEGSFIGTDSDASGRCAQLCKGRGGEEGEIRCIEFGTECRHFDADDTSGYGACAEL